MVLVCTQLTAQDCLSGWSFYRSASIDNTTGGNLSDYQVRIQLNTAELVAAGGLRPDGADLRVFSEDCSPLPFWGDSLGTSNTTDIWVKLPALAAGLSTTIQIYYGNSSATSVANGDNTFLFFDDFESGTIDPAKWEAVGEFASFQIINGILNYTSTGSSQSSRFKFARTVPEFSDKVIFDYNGAVGNSNGFGFSNGEDDEPLTRILWRQAGFGFDTLNQVALIRDTISNGFQVEGLYPLLPFGRDEFNTASITVESNAEDKLEFTRFANVGLNVENTDTYIMEQDTMPTFHFIMSTFSAFGPTLLDNIRVRQHADNPPSVLVGPQMISDPTSVSTLIDPTRVQVFPNPTTDFAQIQIDWQEEVQLLIHDAAGREIIIGQSQLLPGQTQQLNLQQLSNGTYFLQFRNQADGALLHTRQLKVVH
jgi:hypothetical protein